MLGERGGVEANRFVGEGDRKAITGASLPASPWNPRLWTAILTLSTSAGVDDTLHSVFFLLQGAGKVEVACRDCDGELPCLSCYSLCGPLVHPSPAGRMEPLCEKEDAGNG